MTQDEKSAASSEAVRVRVAKCVRCGQPVQPRSRPFCSQRCAEIDLGGWLTERYRVVTDETAQDPSDDIAPNPEDD